MNKPLECNRIPYGMVTPPPSKSLSHRALICGALAQGVSRIGNLDVKGEDVAATLACLQELGITFQDDGAEYAIHGGLKTPSDGAVLDCNESGSTLRFLIPLAMQFGTPVRFTGRGRLLERPLSPYLEVLSAHGGRVEREQGMLTVGGTLVPGYYSLPGDVSSQFVTGLLFALPLLEGDSEIRLTSPLESKDYVALTIAVQEHFGIRLEPMGDLGFLVPGNQKYQATSYRVESDYSAAAFFLVAGALGCKVECMDLSPDSLQGDRAILSILKRVGAEIIPGPNGGLTIQPGHLHAVELDLADIPDLAPPLAALLCHVEGTSRLTGCRRLRLKESDRLHAIASGLNALGAQIQVDGDDLLISGGKNLHGGTVDPSGDHRIAMAAAVASIGSEGAVTIQNSDCVKKSYPNFWKDFCVIDRRINDEQYLGE